MAEPSDNRVALPPPPAWPVVMVAAFVFPGLGHVVRGERLRGAVIGLSIVLLFGMGLWIGGVRVVEFPTFSPTVTNVFARYIGGLLGNVAFLAQFFMGPLTFVAGKFSGDIANNPATAGMMAHGRLADIATIYTGVAGALNLLAIIDATGRCAEGQPARDGDIVMRAPTATDARATGGTGGTGGTA